MMYEPGTWEYAVDKVFTAAEVSFGMWWPGMWIAIGCAVVFIILGHGDE